MSDSAGAVNQGRQTNLDKKAEALEGYTCENCGVPVEPDKASRNGAKYYCSPDCHQADLHSVASDDHRVAKTDGGAR